MVMGTYPPLTSAERIRTARLMRNIADTAGFVRQRVIRRGPRYHIEQGARYGAPAIAKLSLRPRSQDHLTNEKFGREILWLQFLGGRRSSPLVRAVPQLYAAATSPRAWYVREHITGTPFHAGNNEAQFTDRFFTSQNLRWLSALLYDLHHIKKNELPHPFRALLHQPELPQYLWRFIQPYARRIESFTHAPGLTQRLKPRVIALQDVFSRAPRVLGHQELYPAHVLQTRHGLRLIDWENIGWALPSYDWVTVWLRAFGHPSWQRSLYREYCRHYRHYPQATELWRGTILLQSVFNVVGYHFYPVRRHFRPLADYCAAQLIGSQPSKKMWYNTQRASN